MSSAKRYYKRGFNQWLKGSRNRAVEHWLRIIDIKPVSVSYLDRIVDFLLDSENILKIQMTYSKIFISKYQSIINLQFQ